MKDHIDLPQAPDKRQKSFFVRLLLILYYIVIWPIIAVLGGSILGILLALYFLYGLLLTIISLDTRHVEKFFEFFWQLAGRPESKLARAMNISGRIAFVVIIALMIYLLIRR